MTSTGKSINSARWIGLIQVFRILSQFAVLAIVSHFLSPHDYGLAALAGTITGFAALFRDLGTSAAVVQTETLTDKLLDSVFIFNAAVGCVLGLVVFVGAPYFANFLNMDGLKPVLQLAALSFPIMSLGACGQALMERESRFREIARIEIGSITAGLAVLLGCAISGFGVYSIILQALVVAIISTLQIILAVGWRSGRQFSMSSFKSIWGFSRDLSLFNFINYFSRNLDSIVIGRYLGAAELGAYSMAYKIMLFPIQNLTSVASRAAFPIFSKIQNDMEMQRALYLKILSVISFVSAPLMGLVYLGREDFLVPLLGEKWALVGVIVGWLAPIGFLQSIMSTSGMIFMANGKTRRLANVGMLGTFLMCISFISGVRWGVVGVAVAYLIANLIHFMVVMNRVMVTIELPINSIVRAIGYPLLVAVSLLLMYRLLGLSYLYGHNNAIYAFVGFGMLYGILYIASVAVLSPLHVRVGLKLVQRN